MKTSILFILIIYSVLVDAQTCIVSNGSIDISSINSICASGFDKLVVTGPSTILNVDANYTNLDITEVSIENGASLRWTSNKAFTIGSSGILFLNKNGGGTMDGSPCNTNKDFFIGSIEVANCPGSPGIASFFDINIAGGVSSSGPLPVNLIDFHVKIFGKRAVVNWSTASETNCERFELYHGLDGVSYNLLTTVSGAGNSNEIIDYQYSLDDMPSGINYFKLIQVDLDGKFESYLTQVIQASTNNSLITPNPFQDQIVVDLTPFEDDVINLDIFTMTGNKKYSEVLANTINKKITINTSGFLPGVYFLKINTELLRLIKCNNGY
jgi:hypothetical protein